MNEDSFSLVVAVGLELPGVEAAVRYDGSPVLKVAGCFMAGLASHASAEPATLVVRADVDERQLLLDDAPDTYYVTDYYQKYPLVLARLSRLDRAALRDLLAQSWRLTVAKPGARQPRRQHRSTVSDAHPPRSPRPSRDSRRGSSSGRR